MPETPGKFINEKALADMMLAERALLYVGGAGSCMGCGEATALRMMLAATGFVYGQENIGIVAATGCNTVYTSTYPYNPYIVSWTNSLFENAPADAMGVRARWDQLGWENKRLWVIGGDGAMLDIGFQSLSRMLASGTDIKVLVLDTQVYSNTGGQASTGSFKGQDAKMSFHGKAIQGKKENRKELANIAMMHKDVYVAQTTCAHVNHFYKAVMDANEYPGPGDRQRVHDLPARARRRRQHGRTPGEARRGFPHVPGVHLRSAQGAADQGTPEPGRQPEHEGRLVRRSQDRRAVDFITFARSEGRFCQALRQGRQPVGRAACLQSRTGSKTGTCSRNSPA